MKKITIPFLMLFLTMSLFTCDNEPLEPSLLPQAETSELDCLAATQAYSTAVTNFGNWDGNEDTYAPLCTLYAASLQGLIDSCGDPSGSIQALLGTLGDCSEPLDPDTCESAIANSGIAEVNLNNAPADMYTQFCTGYVMALEEQIEICGDADGSIQATIDGLGDCSETSDLVLPKKSIQTYADGSTIIGDYTFNGNKLTKIEYTINFVGEPTETEVEEFTYNGDLLAQIDIVENSAGFTETDSMVLEYNSDNELITVTTTLDDTNIQIDNYVHNPDGTITHNEDGGQVYIYTIENGNIILENNTNGNNDYTYTYDDKNGISKNIHKREVFAVLGYTAFNNNYLSYINTGGSTVPDNENNTYTYNSDNYPITSNTVYNQGSADEETHTTEYTYY
ncbi:hypothetical protein [Lacinutrix mariniflava]|uniref:hypothetical protein n=1 Tax=Lacinutrix mariniflava TaxID=342955 RepID=UPI0006E34026|nr:hypothetical protein [Lacinutrix mariniflava]